MENEAKTTKWNTKKWNTIIAGCLAACVTAIVILTVYVVNLSSDVKDLEAAKQEMQLQFDLEKKELSEKVTLLSSQLAVRIEAEEAEAQKKVPAGLPVSGRVITIESEPIIVATELEGTGLEEGELDAEAIAEIEEEFGEDWVDENIVTQEIPTVVFGVKKETQIVSAGAGVVQSVETVDGYGTSVIIDHGNGYVSVYLFKGTAKVKPGDEVLRGTLIFEVTSNNAQFSFQVLENGQYINPMDIMEIHG